MKAAVLTAPERIETVDDWPEPVHGVGLCGTDLPVLHGRRRSPATPWGMGHEGFGRVVAAGAAVPDRLVGRRVVGASGRAGKTWIDLGSADTRDPGRSEHA